MGESAFSKGLRTMNCRDTWAGQLSEGPGPRTLRSDCYLHNGKAWPDPSQGCTVLELEVRHIS